MPGVVFDHCRPPEEVKEDGRNCETYQTTILQEEPLRPWQIVLVFQ